MIQETIRLIRGIWAQKRNVTCPLQAVLEAMYDSLNRGYGCRITFKYRGKEHTLKADRSGESRPPLFVLDGAEFKGKEGLEARASIDGAPLSGIRGPVVVTAFNGFYPDTHGLLMQYKHLEKCRAAKCPIQTVLQEIKDEYSMGICCDIFFETINGSGRRSHRIGVFGDNGNTYRNVRFYLDREEFGTMEEMEIHARVDGTKLADIRQDVYVTECDGQYPECTEAFREYLYFS